MENLKGKKAIITGGGKGLGKATALAFAKEGIDVAITGRNEKNLQETVAELKALGINATYALFDVGNHSEVKTGIESIVKEEPYQEYNFEDILYMYISEDLLKQGHLSIEDMSRILRMLSDNYESIKDKDPSLSVYRKFGVSVSLLHRNGEIFYSDQAPIVDNYSIRSAVEKLKLKII